MEETFKFYEWLLKIKNIHLADNESMSKAYAIVYDNNIEFKEPEELCTQSI